jgi:hypothetical protein
MKMPLFIMIASLLFCKVSLSAEPVVFGYSSDAMKYDGVAFCKATPLGLMGFKNGPKGLSLIPAKFEKRSFVEGVEALDLEVTDEKPKTCWFLETVLEFPILVRGVKIEGEPSVMKDFLGQLKPKEAKNIAIGSKKYALTFPKVISPNYLCILGETDVDLDGGGFEIILAADLNNDGLPDFIIQNARKYSFKRYQILMSDKTEKKCSVTASKEIYGC